MTQSLLSTNDRVVALGLLSLYFEYEGSASRKICVCDLRKHTHQYECCDLSREFPH